MRVKLEDYLRAGYPLIHCVTDDYATAIEGVFDAYTSIKTVDAESKSGAIYSITRGLQVFPLVEGPQCKKPEAFDLQIDAAIQHCQERGIAIVVFWNIRHEIQQPIAMQAFVDAALNREMCRMVLLGPHFEYPPELQSLITRYDYPLPTQHDIRLIFADTVRANEDRLLLNGNPWGNFLNSKDLSFSDEQELLIEAAAAQAAGLTTVSAENTLTLSIAASDSIDLDIIREQKIAEVAKSEVLEFIALDESIRDLGGFDVLKDWLEERKDSFSDEAREYGLPYLKGILLAGVAGTGKSLCAKVISHYLNVPLLRLDVGAVFQSLLGASEAAVRKALRVAEAVAPCVLMIDEIDKMLAGAGNRSDADAGVSARVLGTILTWRAESKTPVLLVATANDVATLPAMLYRKGRFDEVWAVGLPTEAERYQIFEIHIRKTKRDPEDYDLDALARATDGFVGAEIEAAVVDAMFLAFSDGRREYNTQDLLRVTHREVMVPQSKRNAEDVQAVINWAKSRARMVSSDGVPKSKRRSNVRSIP